MLPIEISSKYELLGTLGSGAMGTVFAAMDRLIERRVAIKVVRRAADHDEEAEEANTRFRREAQAAGRLGHPNIVGVYDYGENQEQAWIVMELVEGGSLNDRLKKQERFGIPEIVRVMEQTLAALAYSHGRNIVHRDIKPANIMLTTDGTVKLADFGIARLENSSMTQIGTVMGTPSYMAPEQLRGETVDLRADIWAAGVVLYQLLTGEKPFEGGFSAVMHKALNTEPVAPSQLSVTCPRSFDAVVAKAMAKRPEDRYANAQAFAEAIRLAGTQTSAAPSPGPTSAEPTPVSGFSGAGPLPGLDSDATVVNAGPRRPSAPTTGDPATPPPTPGPAKKGGAPIGLIAGGAVAVAGAAAAWFFLLGPGAGPSAEEQRLAAERAAQELAAQQARDATQRAELARQEAEAARRAADRQAQEQARLAEAAEARAREERARADATGQNPANDPARLAAEQRAREEQARAEEARRQADAARLAADQRAREEARRVEEARALEAARLAAEQQRARDEAARRQAEIDRQQGDVRSREEAARRAEQERLAAEQRAREVAAQQAERDRLAAEQRARDETARLAEEERQRRLAAERAREEAERERQRLANLNNPPRPDFAAAAAAAARATPCALISYVASDTSLTISGILRRGGDAVLRQTLLNNNVPTDVVRSSVRVQGVDGPYCNAFDAVRPFLVQPSSPPRVNILGQWPLARGEKLRFEVQMPDFPAQMHVAYLTSDGNVAHLVSSRQEAAGARPRLGDPRPGFAGWEVDEPFGTDLLLAFVSDRPLFNPRRPEVEKMEDFVAALGPALRQLQEQGGRVGVRPLVIETVARR